MNLINTFLETNLTSRHKYMKKYYGFIGYYFSMFIELIIDKKVDFLVRGIRKI